MKGPMTALVPVQGTPLDDEVVSLACDLVRPSKGMVWVLYVIEIPRSLPLDAEIPAASVKGEMVLQRMERLGKSQKCKAEGEILQARAVGPAVVREAEERSVDMVMLGMPYQEVYGSPTLGDLAPYLLKHSSSRVLVMRDARGWSGDHGRWR
jgi:hypothetical protein